MLKYSACSDLKILNELKPHFISEFASMFFSCSIPYITDEFVAVWSSRMYNWQEVPSHFQFMQFIELVSNWFIALMQFIELVSYYWFTVLIQFIDARFLSDSWEICGLYMDKIETQETTPFVNLLWIFELKLTYKSSFWNYTPRGGVNRCYG